MRGSSFLCMCRQSGNEMTEGGPLSLQIGMECLIASMLCCVGVVTSMGKFKDIKLTSELKTK